MDEKDCIPGPRNPCGPWTIKDRLGGQVTLLPPDDPRGVEVITEIGYAGGVTGNSRNNIMEEGLYSYQELGRLGRTTYPIVNNSYIRPPLPRKHRRTKDHYAYDSNIEDEYEKYVERYKKVYPNYDSNTDFKNAYQRHLGKIRQGVDEYSVEARKLRALRVEQNEDHGNYIYFRSPIYYDNKIKHLPNVLDRVLHQYHNAYKEDPTAKNTTAVIIKVDPDQTYEYFQGARGGLDDGMPPTANDFILEQRMQLIKSKTLLTKSLERGGDPYAEQEILLLIPHLGPEWFVNKYPLVMDYEKQHEYDKQRAEARRIRIAQLEEEEKAKAKERQAKAKVKVKKEEEAQPKNKPVSNRNTRRASRMAKSNPVTVSNKKQNVTTTKRYKRSNKKPSNAVNRNASQNKNKNKNNKSNKKVKDPFKGLSLLKSIKI